MKYKTIYEILAEYSKEDIDYVLSCLNDEEKLVLLNRFGNDLENPSINRSYNYAYYKKVLPLIKEKLEEVIVLKQIRLEKRVDDICLDLGISEDKFREIIKRLRGCGFKGKRVLYSDGVVKYVVDDGSVGQTIITDTEEDKVKFLLISDLHFGNKHERLDLINQAFEYCSKNGINIILCGGDFLDGTSSFTRVEKQLEHFLKDYPFDKNIVTLGVTGNHDGDVLKFGFLDILTAIRNNREDIIVDTYGKLPINLKNDNILLSHNTKENNSYRIILQGHSHRYMTKFEGNRLKVVIPSLSDVGQGFPGAVEMTIKFKYGKISETYLKHIVFNTKDIVVSDSNYLFSVNNERSEVINTEDYKLRRVLK